MYRYNYNPKNIGRNIRKIRKANHMTQEQLAVALFLSVDSISNFENGKQTCMPEHMMHMCELFNVSMDYFYFENMHLNNNDKKKKILELLDDCEDSDLERVEQMLMLFLKK